MAESPAEVRMRMIVRFVLGCIAAAVCCVVMAQQGQADNVKEIIDGLRGKLDQLQNIRVTYELHNKKKNETREVVLSIHDTRTFRLETEGVTYIVNNGNMIIFGDKSPVAQQSNVRKVQEEYNERTAGFWTENAAELEALFGQQGARLKEALTNNLTYPSIVLRISRAANYTPQNPEFSFTAMAGLVTEQSFYSWLADMESLARDVGVQSYDTFIAVKTNDREYWVTKETGLLDTQKLLNGKQVEASLSAIKVEKNAAFPAGFFDVQAPAGVRVEQTDKMQVTNLFFDVQGVFFREMGGLLADFGLDRMSEADKQRISRVVQNWLDKNFDVFLPASERDREILEKRRDFLAAIEAVYTRFGEQRDSCHTEIYGMQAEGLTQIKRTKDEMDKRIRAPLGKTIRDVLETNAAFTGDSWKNANRLLDGALGESFRRRMVVDYVDRLSTEISDIAKEHLSYLKQRATIGKLLESWVTDGDAAHEAALARLLSFRQFAKDELPLLRENPAFAEKRALIEEALNFLDVRISTPRDGAIGASRAGVIGAILRPAADGSLTMQASIGFLQPKDAKTPTQASLKSATLYYAGLSAPLACELDAYAESESAWTGEVTGGKPAELRLIAKNCPAVPVGRSAIVVFVLQEGDGKEDDGKEGNGKETVIRSERVTVTAAN